MVRRSVQGVKKKWRRGEEGGEEVSEGHRGETGTGIDEKVCAWSGGDGLRRGARETEEREGERW